MTRGQLGENIATEYLLKKGFRLIEKNYHSRFGEIDIIMCDDKYLLFVEVKLRKNSKYGTPAEYVTESKQQKIILTAQSFLSENETDLQPRFDVIEIYMKQTSEKPDSILHIENAFEA